MEEIIDRLLARGKGLLAADESTKTIVKRFVAIGLQSTAELNRKYRQMLFTTAGIEQFLGGVIMFDETVRQKTDEGIPFPEYLMKRGIVPGIKVDGGLEAFNSSEEQITKGLEGLDARLKEYSAFGLKFTKWRAAIKISDIFPSDAFLEEDLNRMTQFAKISQANGFVPIVEPEVLLDGNHTTTRCAEISVKVWRILFEKLKVAGVNLRNLMLKTNMVLPGKDSGVKVVPLEVAEATLRSLKESVPPEVGGIVFLSGGQTPDEATNNLNEIVKRSKSSLPAARLPAGQGRQAWPLSFSFSRALQEETMRAWSGKDENIGSAQEVFLDRLMKVSKAREGCL